MEIEQILLKVKQYGKRVGLRDKTISTYGQAIKSFAKWFKLDLTKVKKSDINKYLDHLVSKNKSNSSLNVFYSSMKFLLNVVFRRRVLLDKKFCKNTKTLPTYLTQKEITKETVIIKETEPQTKKTSLIPKTIIASAAIIILSKGVCFKLSGSISNMDMISKSSTLFAKSDNFLVFFTFPLRAYTPSVSESLACFTEPAADNPSVI